ncbi:hypothetical protein UFOVP207_9 [uncultured Caudovirales phage]|uniref:Uncharacterized protein n=1 Tax=uncultured Caudovirales phage TaxID=2100421 RepID=A0A6J7WIU4_9CAUD|nr:hypothetical protein UFOVP207_9 [uncultured Caudovirales phage]
MKKEVYKPKQNNIIKLELYLKKIEKDGKQKDKRVNTERYTDTRR